MPSKHTEDAYTQTRVAINSAAGGATTTSSVGAVTQTGTYVGSYTATGFSLSWIDTPSYTDFTFVCTAPLALNNVWMGMAVSKDQVMGDDDAVVCKLWGSSTLAVERYYNPGQTRPVYTSPTNPSLGLSNTRVTSNGSAVTCAFRRDKATGGNAQIFDLNNDYFILIAQGGVQASNEISNFC